MIKFKNIIKTYDNNTVINNLSLTIEQGEIFVLVGPSGSGKTTLLKMINRLIEPTSGSVYFQDQLIHELVPRELRLQMGYVLQQIALFPNMTVAENIGLIPEMKGWSKKERLEKTTQLLDKVGLLSSKYLKRYPSELSGGEQQRIGILRAIITNPKVLLMDEPFSALDPISRKQLQDLTLALQEEFGMTIVFVTHDIDEALRLGDRIAVLNKGELIQVGTPEELIHSPENEFVESLFKGGRL
ncbi:ABC transporter ATP-binding protein [Streptococcus zalophi]|uniref:ABC-type quaternary amine transporter n=1 Tax=Streptococcus zalophi TaxID=640031 RepID=A0A934UD91_9STRE|nr:ABC transporter ATP-binding protein [Streptococcus zalophi]MBJ8349428.1 ABC transporter ATP-binding protein [Streptococcus zalophi]MCR8967377.1 ABC transporter ATP-binding protein [Streptococcus zalophi]